MENTMAPGTAPAVPASEEDRIYRKVGWRLVPLLVVCYVVAYLDRVNVGFAKLQMLQELQFSETVYGLGAGIFFIGYFLFEIPSNIILHKVGARVWIARIMITWGLISSCMMFVSSVPMFYALRFLLGAAEAGFFPGIILYLTYWYPAERAAHHHLLHDGGAHVRPDRRTDLGLDHEHLPWRPRPVGLAVAVPAGGHPSVIIGVLVLLWLDDRINKAKWLTANEKAVLIRNIAAEEQHKEDPPIRAALAKPRVWAYGADLLSFVMGLYGVGFWMPTLIKATGVQSPLAIGLLTAVPNLFAVIGMILIARNSDRNRERRWHVAIPALFGALGLLFSAVWSGNTALAIVALTVANIGICTVLPLFWSLPTALLAAPPPRPASR